MYYKLQVSEYTDFSELVVNKIVEELTGDVIKYGLESGVLYYWRVKSINNQTGKESDWSSIWLVLKLNPQTLLLFKGVTLMV